MSFQICHLSKDNFFYLYVYACIKKTTKTKLSIP